MSLTSQSILLPAGFLFLDYLLNGLPEFVYKVVGPSYELNKKEEAAPG